MRTITNGEADVSSLPNTIILSEVPPVRLVTETTTPSRFLRDRIVLKGEECKHLPTSNIFCFRTCVTFRQDVRCNTKCFRICNYESLHDSGLSM